MDPLLFLLQHRRWDPKCLRANIARPDQIEIFKKTKKACVDSNVCSKSSVDILIRKAVKELAPEWFGEDTRIVLNRNVQCERHCDSNDGHSWIMFLGDFVGGALVFENGERVEEPRIWHRIDGRVPHWNEPHTGTKYSVIFFKTKPRVAKHEAIRAYMNK